MGAASTRNAMKIYVASSWRNPYQPSVVAAVRAAGHEVYDFRNPGPGQHGFSWAEVDSNWQQWSVSEFRRGLAHPRACAGFAFDQSALEWCDACILVLPSGMSAHLEAGWCAGRGKPTAILAPELREAELMYKLFDVDGITPIHERVEDVLVALTAHRS